MKFKKAIEILENIAPDIREGDNGLDCVLPGIYFFPKTPQINLNGDFTAEQLRALATYMEEAKLLEDY